MLGEGNQAGGCKTGKLLSLHCGLHQAHQPGAKEVDGEEALGRIKPSALP